jgi:hypothetical protein
MPWFYARLVRDDSMQFNNSRKSVVKFRESSIKICSKSVAILPAPLAIISNTFSKIPLFRKQDPSRASEQA